MTVREAARQFGVSISTIYRWLRNALRGKPSKVRGEKVDGRWRVRDEQGTQQEAQSNMRAITVNWRSVSYNEPSNNMPRSVPWVYGLMRELQGRSPRVELAPKRRKGEYYPIHLIMLHPNQREAEAMDWDATVEVTVDGYTVKAQKSLGPVDGWCGPDVHDLYALVAELDADHPLVVHAAEAAKAPKEAMDKAEQDFLDRARDWCDLNFPHPNFMNVVRSLLLFEWKHKAGYWPGDPLPNFDVIMNQAKESLIRGH